MDVNEATITKDKRCRGLIFRASASQYFNINGIGQVIRLRLLKRKSCSGCEYCGWMVNDFNESEYPQIRGMGNIRDRKIYKLIVTNESRDFETGYVDNYDFELTEVKDV